MKQLRKNNFIREPQAKRRKRYQETEEEWSEEEEELSGECKW
jgi:hypothetical protein